VTKTRQLSETWAIAILLVGFFVVVFGVFAVDVAGWWRTPDGPRDRVVLGDLQSVDAPTADVLIDGTWAKAVQRKLPRASLVARMVRPYHRAITLGLFSETPDDVVLGKDNWLFYGPTLSPKKHDPIEPLVSTIALAVQRGIPVALVMIPSKAQIYPENLIGASQVKQHDRQDEILDLCRASNIPTIDLRPLLRAAKGKGDEPLYHPTDTHTTTTGHLVIAKAIAMNLFQAGEVRCEETRLLLLDRRAPTDAKFPGDLHVMLDLPSDSSLNDRYFVPFRKPPVVAEVPIDPQSEFVWIGDSFSRYYESFLPRACALMCGWKSVDFRSYAPNWETLARERLMASPPPKQLVICLAARWF
jgi:hypothetical protein